MVYRTYCYGSEACCIAVSCKNEFLWDLGTFYSHDGAGDCHLTSSIRWITFNWCFYRCLVYHGHHIKRHWRIAEVDHYPDHCYAGIGSILSVRLRSHWLCHLPLPQLSDMRRGWPSAAIEAAATAPCWMMNFLWNRASGPNFHGECYDNTTTTTLQYARVVKILRDRSPTADRQSSFRIPSEVSSAVELPECYGMI